MLQQLVARWLRQQAQEAVMQSLNPDRSNPTEEGSEDSIEESEPQVDIVCVFPTAAEAGGLVDKQASGPLTKCNGFSERVGLIGKANVAIVEANLPHEQLAPAVRDVLSLRSPKWVVTTGFAVALDEVIRRGAIMVAGRIIDEHDYSLNTGTNMQEAKGLHVGTLLTRAALPTQAEKHKLAETPAIACDTQAAVIAEVCRLQKIPMMAIHLVAQGLRNRPSSIIAKTKSQDSIAGLVGAVAGALLDQPGSVKEFWNDKESALKASDRLANFLVGVLAQLPVA